MRKLLVLLLVVLALTSVVQLAMISHPKTADAKGLPEQCCSECSYAWGQHWCYIVCGAGCSRPEYHINN